MGEAQEWAREALLGHNLESMRGAFVECEGGPPTPRSRSARERDGTAILKAETEVVEDGWEGWRQC